MDTTKCNKYNFAILGCGLTGSLTASLLVKKGYTVAVFEKLSQQQITSPSIRTVTLNAKTFDIYCQSEVLTHLHKNQCGLVDEIKVINADSTDCISFDSDSEFSSMGYVFYNHTLQSLSIERLEKSKNATLFFNQKNYTIDDKKIKLEEEEIYFDNLIICEGASSETLNNFGFKNIFNHSYNFTALMCQINHSLSHQNIALEQFLPQGPIALLPLKEANKSTIVWTNTQKVTNFLLQNPTNLQDAVTHYFCNFIGNVSLEELPLSFPLRLKINFPFKKDNIYLLGNSLYTMHPLAGQGFNLIARDIEFFCDNFESEVLNSTWFKSRFLDQASMIGSTHILSDLFSNNSNFIKKTSTFAMQVLDSAPTIKSIISTHAMGYTFV